MEGDTLDDKKEMERAELHRAIWQIANDLHGSVDGWDFKQYVLGTFSFIVISRRTQTSHIKNILHTLKTLTLCQ